MVLCLGNYFQLWGKKNKQKNPYLKTHKLCKLDLSLRYCYERKNRTSLHKVIKISLGILTSHLPFQSTQN